MPASNYPYMQAEKYDKNLFLGLFVVKLSKKSKESLLPSNKAGKIPAILVLVS